MTRRRFLVASGVTGGVAIAGGAATIGVAQLLRTARHPQAAERKTGTLVIVTLYGGNDGLNTLIPYADPAYHAARPQLAYQPEQVLHLDDQLGLNPMLTGLSQLWQQHRLAIVRGVGYPTPDRSHFRSMDIWQTASPQHPAGSGWIGRWLDGTRAAPQTAVSFEAVLPPLMVGKSRVGSCVSIDQLRLPPGFGTQQIAALGAVQAGEPDMVAKAAASYTDLVNLEHLIQNAEQSLASADPGSADPTATGTGGGNTLTAQLAVVGRCVEAGVPTQVYSVSLGGFDFHAEERGGHEQLLKQLDTALTGFVTRMAGSEAGRQVTVLVYSEFGRRVRANASDGTDHGTAGPVLVLGPRVTGGFYGEQPSLSDLDSGDLKATMDFRDVFATLLASVLHADPEQYLQDYRPHLLPLLPDD